MTSELTGELSVEFQPGKNLDSFCAKYIPNYDTNRFEAAAIRFYAGKEIIVTVFAHDKLSPKNENGHFPVKKFKLENLDIDRLLNFILSFNFTVFGKDFDIEHMKVINK